MANAWDYKKFDDLETQSRYDDFMWKYKNVGGQGGRDAMSEGNALWDAEQTKPVTSTPESAPQTEAPPPNVSAPSADDVAKEQVDAIEQTKKMAQAQGSPDDTEGGRADGKEKASRRRKAASTGKRGLNVRRASGSGLNI